MLRHRTDNQADAGELVVSVQRDHRGRVGRPIAAGGELQLLVGPARLRGHGGDQHLGDHGRAPQLLGRISDQRRQRRAAGILLIANLHRGLQRQQRRRNVVQRVHGHDVAADGAPILHLPAAADLAGGECQQRGTLAHQRVVLNVPVHAQGADGDAAVGGLDTPQLIQVADIHQHRWGQPAVIEVGHQFLAAGDDHGATGQTAQQLRRLVQTARPRILHPQAHATLRFG